MSAFALLLAAALLTQTSGVQTPEAQAPAPPAPPQPAAPVLPPITTPPFDVAVLAETVASPDCGGLYGLQGRAFCVSAPLVQVGAVAEAYIADLQAKGWLVAAGDANRVVFVRRKADQTCDGLQMQAFYDTTAIATPTQPGFLAFGVVPGDVCAGQSSGQPAGPTAP